MLRTWCGSDCIVSWHLLWQPVWSFICLISGCEFIRWKTRPAFLSYQERLYLSVRQINDSNNIIHVFIWYNIRHSQTLINNKDVAVIGRWKVNNELKIWASARENQSFSAHARPLRDANIVLWLKFYVCLPLTCASVNSLDSGETARMHTRLNLCYSHRCFSGFFPRRGSYVKTWENRHFHHDNMPLQF